MASVLKNIKKIATIFKLYTKIGYFQSLNFILFFSTKIK